MIKAKKPIGFLESVILMAMMSSLSAMSIDAMLPALSEIGMDLGLQRANDSQLVLSLFFLGMAVGQMFYGPLSDSIGRKPTIYIGSSLFAAGCLVSMVTTSFKLMLVGRVLQGLGTAAPRSLVVAVVRDQYRGRAMARVMSYVMAVLILAPVLAPAFGQAVLLMANWRMIFGTYLILVLAIGIWFALRQPETLPPNRRIPFSLIRIGRAIREIVTLRTAFGYIIAAGLVSGAFNGYLNSAQQVFQEQYGRGQLFPLYFATSALSLGVASTVNARLVVRFGMRALSFRALQGIIALSVAALGITVVSAGQPPLWLLMLYFLLTFFCIGVLFGNLNALAMEPLGHIAGVGAAAVGSLSTFISFLLGTLIGQSYNGTVFPLIGGFFMLSITAMGVMRWVETKKPLAQVS